MNKTFCIAGAGTYGSYLANALLERYPFAKIILIDVGNKNIKSESEIGFSSSLKENRYNAASSGRFLDWVELLTNGEDSYFFYLKTIASLIQIWII